MTQALDAIANLIKGGRMQEASRALEKTAETEQNRSELLFLRGYCEELSHERKKAISTYQRLLQQDPHHNEGAFHLALLYDQAGDDEAALKLLESCVSEMPAHQNALINLAVLYEESGFLREAEECLRSVLDTNPNHHRAHQLLKSVESSYSMNYDEKSSRGREQHSAIMDAPITDFELSVRSRNCLRQMQIRTIGDLMRISETELLSYKNFGETSLNEIKALLAQKGLRVGQTIQPVVERPMRSASLHQPSGDGSSILHKPVSELELSVRARKCLQWLGINTLGDLAVHSEAELLSIKNFGQTSMQELKRQLALYGLSLR